MLISDKNLIGNKIHNYRAKSGFTQVKAAETAGMSAREYSDIERGYKNMRVDSLIKICRTYNITPNDLLTDDNILMETEPAVLQEAYAYHSERADKLLNLIFERLNKK